MPNLEVYFEKFHKKIANDRYGYTAIPHRGDATHIAINIKFKEWPEICRQILLYEMIHARYPHVNPHHGKIFEKEKLRLIKRGAINDLI
jgi:hypothetical protein